VVQMGICHNSGIHRDPPKMEFIDYTDWFYIIDSVVPQFSQDISEMILKYLFIWQFKVPIYPYENYNISCCAISSSRRRGRFYCQASRLEYLCNHLEITRTKINVIHFSAPWIFVPIVPNITSEFKLGLQSSVNVVSVILIEKGTHDFDSYIGYGEPFACKLSMQSSLVFISVAEEEKCDYVQFINGETPNQYYTRKLKIEKGTLNQYSILVGCGYRDQCVSLVDPIFL
jgi:hypothetical protein